MVLSGLWRRVVPMRRVLIGGSVRGEDTDGAH
jgi:hypothetical protein